jgi:putative transposase
LRMLTVLDEHSRECLAIVVGRSPTSDDVLATMTDLFTRYRPPAHIPSDNGPEMTAEVVRDWLRSLGRC